MRINLIVNSFPTISETFLFNKVTGLESIGHEVLVCSLNDAHNRDYYHDRLTEWSSNKVSFSEQKWAFLRSLVFDGRLRMQNKILKRKGKSFRERLAILRRFHFLNIDQPDIIHFSFSGIAAEFHECMALDTKAKLFFSCRGSAEKIRPLIDSERSKKLKSAFLCADRIHCVSEDMRRTVSQYVGINDKTFINHPSVNTTSFTFNKRTQQYLRSKAIPFKILSTGRLHFQKGYVYALLAIKRLTEEGINLEYNICGGGAEEGLIRYMIQELSLESSVIMHGKVSGATVKSMLKETDIFLLPSIYEGIANAALEAIASGVPLLTTKAGGMNEVVKHRVNGLIVDRFDSEQLAEGISFYYSNPETALSFSENALETLESQFLHEQQIKIFDNEYRQAFHNE